MSYGGEKLCSLATIHFYKVIQFSKKKKPRTLVMDYIYYSLQYIAHFKRCS